MWCLHILHGTQGLCERNQGMNNSPKSHRLSVQKISSPQLYCSIWNHSALVRETPCKQRVSQSPLCRNALEVTSLAAVLSGFSENENAWRPWSTGLDLMLCTKINLKGPRANKLSAASLWEKGMVNDTPSRKIGRENIICKERQKTPLYLHKFLPRKWHFLVPFKDTCISRQMEIYILAQIFSYFPHFKAKAFLEQG